MGAGVGGRHPVAAERALEIVAGVVAEQFDGLGAQGAVALDDLGQLELGGDVGVGGLVGGEGLGQLELRLGQPLAQRLGVLWRCRRDAQAVVGPAVEAHAVEHRCLRRLRLLQPLTGLGRAEPLLGGLACVGDLVVGPLELLDVLGVVRRPPQLLLDARATAASASRMRWRIATADRPSSAAATAALATSWSWAAMARRSASSRAAGDSTCSLRWRPDALEGEPDGQRVRGVDGEEGGLDLGPLAAQLLDVAGGHVDGRLASLHGVEHPLGLEQPLPGRFGRRLRGGVPAGGGSVERLLGVDEALGDGALLGTRGFQRRLGLFERAACPDLHHRRPATAASMAPRSSWPMGRAARSPARRRARPAPASAPASGAVICSTSRSTASSVSQASSRDVSAATRCASAALSWARASPRARSAAATEVASRLSALGRSCGLTTTSRSVASSSRARLSSSRSRSTPWDSMSPATRATPRGTSARAASSSSRSAGEQPRTTVTNGCRSRDPSLRSSRRTRIGYSDDPDPLDPGRLGAARRRPARRRGGRRPGRPVRSTPAPAALRPRSAAPRSSEPMPSATAPTVAGSSSSSSATSSTAAPAWMSSPAAACRCSSPSLRAVPVVPYHAPIIAYVAPHR